MRQKARARRSWILESPLDDVRADRDCWFGMMAKGLARMSIERRGFVVGLQDCLDHGEVEVTTAEGIIS